MLDYLISLEIIISSAATGWLIGDAIVAVYYRVRNPRDPYVPLTGPFTYIIRKAVELRLKHNSKPN